MKQLLTVLAIALAAFTFSGAVSAQDSDLSKYKKIDYTVRDLALIYQGGKHRIDWNKREIEPYVTHKFADGHEEWLFDGFLFLEFTTGGSPAYQFTEGYNGNNSKKEHWEWYLTRLFEKNMALDALNKVIKEKKKTLGDPGFKHKVALTLFVPIQNQKDWGELDGKALNFGKAADRLAAGEWFVDELIKGFNEGNYDNLELYGIYMICESQTGIETFTRKMKPKIEKRGLEFLWIPYFSARGNTAWEALGFDIAYLQPNHFFSAETPDSRLDDAIKLAKANGMAMELECDEKCVTNQSVFLPRLEAYLNYFERYGIWYDTPVAHYTGNHLLLDFVNRPNEERQAVADRYCQYIINRRLANVESSAVEDVITDDVAPEYYNLQGHRVENPYMGIFIEKRGNKVRKVIK